MEGGRALAVSLSGRVNPSVHMPFAMPVDEAYLPPFALKADHAGCGLLPGQWHLDAMSTPPRYSFGHGLSYTDFWPATLRVEPAPGGGAGRLDQCRAARGGRCRVRLRLGSGLCTPASRAAARGFPPPDDRSGRNGGVTIPLNLRQLPIRTEGRWIWEPLPLLIEAGRCSDDPEAVRWTGDIPNPLR